MIPLVLVGLVTTSLVQAPYAVFVELVPAPTSAPVERLSGLMERELERLRAKGVEVVAHAASAGADSRGCGATLIAARFQLPRGRMSGFFRGIAVLSEQADAPICGLAYRQELDARSLRALAITTGLPVVALVLAILLLRDRAPPRRPLTGTLPGIGTALRLGATAGVSCVLLALLLVWSSSHLGLPMDSIGAIHIGSLVEMAWLAVLVVFCAPLVEEYAFRLRFLDAARKAVGPGIALVLSAGAFAAFHLPGTLATLVLFWALGLVLGALWLRSRSLLACVIAHATYNAAVSAWTIRALV